MKGTSAADGHESRFHTKPKAERNTAKVPKKSDVRCLTCETPADASLSSAEEAYRPSLGKWAGEPTGQMV